MATTVCIPLAVHLPFGEDITIRQDTGISIPFRILVQLHWHEPESCNHVQLHSVAHVRT